jgi:hypothetical protein
MLRTIIRRMPKQPPQLQATIFPAFDFLTGGVASDVGTPGAAGSWFGFGGTTIFSSGNSDMIPLR